MKKSELKKYIRENIISELSESTEDEIAKTKELTQAVQDLESAKKEAGIEEKVAQSSDDVIDPAEYGDIADAYLKGFHRKNNLSLDQLETLGRKIVKQLYKGDVGKAYDDIVKRGAMNEDEVEIPSSTMLKINNSVKTSPSAAKAMLDFYNQMAEKENIDFSKNAKFKIAIDKLTDLAGDKVETPVTEDEDKEPSKSDIKKTKGLAKAKEELALLTREMKSLAKKYSKAEGEEKEKLVKTLKAKTKLKKELESILDNKKI